MSKSHRPKTNPDSMPDLDAISPVSEELSFDDIDIPVPQSDMTSAEGADEIEIDPALFETAPMTPVTLNETVEIPLSDEMLAGTELPARDAPESNHKGVKIARISGAIGKRTEDIIPAGAFPAVEKLPDAGPILHCENAKRSRNADLCMTLFVLLVFAVYLHGARALTLLLFSLAGSCLCELWGCLARGRSARTFRTDAVLDGLLWACLLPASCPFALAAFGAAFASVLRQVTDRFRVDFLSPVVVTRLLSVFIFPSVMNAYPAAGEPLRWFDTAVQTLPVSPLSALRGGYLPEISAGNAIFGYFSGAMGTVALFLIVPAAVYLCVRRVCAWQPTVLYAGVFFALNLVFARTTDVVMFALLETACGGVLFGAVWLVGGSRILPVTATGRAVFGCGCAVLHFICRQVFPAIDAMALAITVMGCLSHPLDSWLHPVRQKQKRLNHSHNRVVQQRLAQVQSEDEEAPKS